MSNVFALYNLSYFKNYMFLPYTIILILKKYMLVCTNIKHVDPLSVSSSDSSSSGGSSVTRPSISIPINIERLERLPRPGAEVTLEEEREVNR